MSELIDREALKEDVKRYAGEPIKEKDGKCQAICLDMLGTIDSQPTVSPWHRAEEEPRDGQECVIAYLGPTDWIYEHATYHSDLNKALEDDIFIEGTDGFIVDSDVGYARHGLFKYWMPIEPPKEDA